MRCCCPDARSGRTRRKLCVLGLTLFWGVADMPKTAKGADMTGVCKYSALPLDLGNGWPVFTYAALSLYLFCALRAQMFAIVRSKSTSHHPCHLFESEALDFENQPKVPQTDRGGTTAALYWVVLSRSAQVTSNEVPAARHRRQP